MRADRLATQGNKIQNQRSKIYKFQSENKQELHFFLYLNNLTAKII